MHFGTVDLIPRMTSPCQFSSYAHWYVRSVWSAEVSHEGKPPWRCNYTHWLNKTIVYSGWVWLYISGWGQYDLIMKWGSCSHLQNKAIVYSGWVWLYISGWSQYDLIMKWGYCSHLQYPVQLLMYHKGLLHSHLPSLAPLYLVIPLISSPSYIS